MFSRHFGLLSLSIALGACAVGPSYERPAVQSAASFAGAAEVDSQTEVPLEQWWKVFDDETLVTLVSRAVTDNKDIDAALARVREARAARSEAFQSLFPGGNLNAAYTNERTSTARNAQFGAPPGGAFVRDLEIYRGSLDAAWEIDLFGGVRRGLEARSAEEESRRAQLDDALRLVIAEVGRTYFELRGAQHQLEVAKKNVKNQDETVRLTKVLVESGQGTELDTARAVSQLKTTMASVPLFEEQVRSSIFRLSVLIGQQPQELLPLLSPVKPIPLFGGAPVIGSPEELLRRRPDIRASERQLAAATASVGVATSDLFPKIKFNGSLALEATEWSGLGNSGSDSYSFGPSISWAAFQLNRVYTRIRAADARAQGALATYEQTVLLALQETEIALNRFAKEKTRRALLLDAVAASEHAFGLARLQYENGLIEFLAVLDAQRGVLATQSELAKSETALAAALVGIYKTLGGGWESFELRDVPKEAVVTASVAQ